MFNKSEDIKELSVALVAAQKEIESAPKDAKNPYFKSTYADLTSVIAAVKPALNKHGIAFLQAVNCPSGTPIVETILLHTSSQFISSETPIYCAKPNDPQAFGSGVTYSKRYALQAILGLPTDDDDGNAASKVNKTPPQPQPIEKVESKPLPIPDDAAQKIIDAIVAKVKTLAAVHKREIDTKKLERLIYTTNKGSYPTEANRINGLVVFATNHITEIYKEV